MLAVNETLAFDTSEVATLQEDIRASAETANLLLNTHTLNEVRSSVFGLPALDGGDSLPNAPAQPATPFLGLSMPQTKSSELEQEEDDGADFEIKAIPQSY